MFDTIAAIATSLSESGIGIIRVSGPEAISISNRILVNDKGLFFLEKCNSHTIHHGYVVSHSCFENKDWKFSKDAIVDEILVSVMKAPKSFTAEDTVEINCHGGILLLQTVLSEVLCAGARLAEPGEFTKRAFLNGRMDLSEAEAVMSLISSGNDFAMKSSLAQLSGVLSDKIRTMRQAILYEIAYIESALDDPEHISLEGYEERLREILVPMEQQLSSLIENASYGKMVQEGIATVILGKPNAGKSSLMNLFLGEDRAIVTDIAGTTRDSLEETVRMKDFSLRLIDTAGIRITEDTVEKIGVERAKTLASMADLILFVADSSRPLDESDEEILSLLSDKKVIALLNKADLSPAFSEEELTDRLPEGCKFLSFSAKQGDGMDRLQQEISDLFFTGKISSGDVLITSLRQKECLVEAKKSIFMVMQSLDNGMEEDFLSIDLTAAYASLGKILGEEVGDDVVQEIFSKFCMGK